MWIILLLLCVCSSQTERVRKKCELPELRHGFVVPVKDDYEHNSDLYYGCDKGWKPAIKTWWPALKCNDGKWSHTPECIDQNACIATTVPHAQLVNDFSSWYANNTVVQYKCNPGYGSVETDKATCVNGRWTLPQCKQKNGVCNPPAQIYNVIILTPYQDVFEHDQRLKYVCRSGYKMDGRDFSVCKNGAWSDQLRCVPEEHSPAPEKPKLVERPTQPDLNNNERTFARETENEDHHRPAYSRPSHIIHCGSYPTIENGDVFEQQNGRALIVQCARFYKLEGEDKVMCVNKKWTTLPVCKEPCKLNTRLFHYHKPEYMQDGEEIYDYCRESWEKMHVKCINAQAFYRGCGFSEW